MSFIILRDAKVKASYGPEEKGYPTLSLEISAPGHTFTHVFPRNTPECKMMYELDLKTISALYNGGYYVFYDGILRDYRRGDYEGFIHNDENMARMADLIGAKDMSNSASSDNIFNRMRGRSNNGLFMGGEWDKFALDVKELGEGGEFNNRLIYRYNPFTANITTSLEIERLVCTNGMISLSEFLSYEVPVISNWNDNLTTVANRIKPEMNETMRQRFMQMASERSSVLDIMNAHEILESRFESAETVGDIERLRRLAELTDVEKTLGLYYNESVFKSQKSRYVDGDLTQFDIYNILTEASSHTTGEEDSDLKAQVMANKIMFNGAKNGIEVAPVVPKNFDNSHTRAFFGA